MEVRIIVYLKTIIWYPAGKAKEVAKKSLEVAQKYPVKPEISERLVVGAGTGIKGSIQSESIAKVKKGKLEEAIKYATKMLLEYAEIEGFSFQMIPLMEFEEALKLIGL